MKAGKATSPAFAIGLALVTGSMLAFEILLTRIFSVTMWYHFAFLAISVAMFGTSLGASVVFVRGRWFPQQLLPSRLALVSILLAASIPLALAAHLAIPFMPVGTLAGVASVVGTYLAVSIPLVLGGIVVALVLTRFSEDSSRLYAWDLAGAAAGCLLVFLLMRITDGPTAVIAAALPAAGAAWVFRLAAHRPERRRVLALAVVSLLLVALVAGNGTSRLVRIRWSKDGGGMGLPRREGQMLIERWDPVARVVVLPGSRNAVGWGLSPRWRGRPTEADTKIMLLDNSAMTPIFEFRAGFEKLRFLRDDVTALAFRGMPPGKRVAVIGVGGGKDVLTALSYEPSQVVAIELNRAVVQVLTVDLDEFMGGLGARTDVRIVQDEARSRLESSDETYDVIQASLIDSWAATAAGAFVLAENGLYTVEGWETFLSRLTDDGVVTFSRWYVRNQPGELLRLTSVVCEAFRRLGVADPSPHLFLAASPPLAVGGYPPLSVVTLIAARNPLVPARVNEYVEASQELGFEVLFAPGSAARPPELAAMIDPLRREALIAGYPLELRPSTDDRPFFFNMLSPLRAFAGGIEIQGFTEFNIRAVRLVVYLLFAVLALSVVAILLPLRMTSDPDDRAGGSRLTAFLYFAGIGLGFMLLEMGQVQRLSLYLGHPTYGLAVVLTGVLLSAGLGSLAARSWSASVETRGRALVVAAVWLALIAASIVFTPPILHAARGAGPGARVALSLVLVGFPGFLMGMPMPFGLAKAGRIAKSRLPWLWGVNGAASVVGSVFGMILAIGWGITAAMGAGLLFYTLGAPFLAAEDRTD